MTKIVGLIMDEIDLSRDGTTLAVGLSSDSELECPSAIADLFGLIQAEVNNINLAVKASLINPAISCFLLVLSSA